MGSLVWPVSYTDNICLLETSSTFRIQTPSTTSTYFPTRQLAGSSPPVDNIISSTPILRRGAIRPRAGTTTDLTYSRSRKRAEFTYGVVTPFLQASQIDQTTANRAQQVTTATEVNKSADQPNVEDA